ncbi:MAG TPA: hypothetical protein VH299_04820 [Solirubrobacterales bacterium]|nr:hypothetical protein [Solirubrobacterales bacterium]
MPQPPGRGQVVVRSSSPKGAPSVTVWACATAAVASRTMQLPSIAAKRR